MGDLSPKYRTASETEVEATDQKRQVEEERRAEGRRFGDIDM